MSEIKKLVKAMNKFKPNAKSVLDSENRLLAEISALHSQLSTRATALRCMQQILKANGSMTYEEFKINLEGCGLTEEELGEI